ncbi:hypothetical protein [Zavarzinella formosa]|uniref:hypothetical protein n=1 Tax=Zavarzinella formosa TaxID=360055 RepID=UPI00031BDC6D|nr:hypothetical protein [Zavarzinella formosa]
MEQPGEILLGNGWHTLYSDEVWYLIVDPGPREITLEARFESDAPGRTGPPTWARTEFCVSKDEHKAVCRVPYNDAAHLLAASRISFVPEIIWAKALGICRRIASGTKE